MARATMHFIEDTSMAADLVFHRPSASVQRYLDDRMDEYTRTIKTTAPEFARRVKEKFEAVRSSVTRRYIDGLKHHMDSVLETDTIRYLKDIPRIQNAPPRARRWIMAQPDIRKRYLNKGCSGYEGEFDNPHPEGVGRQHYDYRRVMDGIAHIDERGIPVIHQFYDSNIQEEDILEPLQKNAMIGTWAVIEKHIEAGLNEDPVSEWGGTM
ncbi:MAG: hypothetical protein ACXVLT_05245 [Flavisolibacter sp.]